jgi:hypothetical protein
MSPSSATARPRGSPCPSTRRRNGSSLAFPLQEVARAWDIAVLASPTHLRGAKGTFRLDAIELGVANLSTWTHELVHAADDRLGQLRQSSTLSREVVAELGGAILLEALGQTVESDRGGAYDYIRRYAEKENRTAFDVCSELIERTCRCVEHILQTAEEIAGDAGTVAA